jgi:hypothetical protein
MIRIDWSKRETAKDRARAAEADAAARARAYLAETDWYVTRLNDPSDGRPIPQEILDARVTARLAANEKGETP